MYYMCTYTPIEQRMIWYHVLYMCIHNECSGNDTAERMYPMSVVTMRNRLHNSATWHIQHQRSFAYVVHAGEA